MQQRKEVITLQLGGFSNYVGTHFWNIQACDNRSHTIVQCSYIEYTIVGRAQEPQERL